MLKTASSDTLVVVDDEADVHDDIRECLPVGPIAKLMKLSSKKAFDRAFEDIAQSPVPAMFFVDMRMESPKSGIEILTSIRASGELRHVPVVILSTSDEHDDVFDAYEGGANFYLPKGHEPSALPDAVKALLDFWTTTGRLPVQSAR